jgi:hypothetical protein
VNELIINTSSKDFWNAEEPENEAQFQEFYKNPSVAQALELIFGVPVPPTPRTDLLSLFLKYPGQALDGDNCGKPCAELLRLDLRVAPTPPEEQKRLTILAHDAPMTTLRISPFALSAERTTSQPWRATASTSSAARPELGRK